MLRDICEYVCALRAHYGQKFSERANLIQKSYREPKHLPRVTNHPLMQLMRLHCSLYSLITEQECMDEKISFILESQYIFFFQFRSVLSFIDIQNKVGLQ